MPVIWIEGKWNARALGNFQEFLDASGQKPFFLWLGFVDPHRPYKNSINGAPAVHDPAQIKTLPPYLARDKATRADIAAYYDEIHRMDDHIGRMVQEVEVRNLLRNTIIIYLSDNGYPFPRGKGTLYESGIQTPFVVHWKGKIKPGNRYPGLLSTIDLAPTLLDLAGVPVPEDMYGRSFRNALFDQSVPGRDMIFAERN